MSIANVVTISAVEPNPISLGVMLISALVVGRVQPHLYWTIALMITRGSNRLDSLVALDQALISRRGTGFFVTVQIAPHISLHITPHIVVNDRVSETNNGLRVGSERHAAN